MYKHAAKQPAPEESQRAQQEREESLWPAILALLIDGENISPQDIDEIMICAQSYGLVNIRRISGNWARAPMTRWREAGWQHGLTPIHHAPPLQARIPVISRWWMQCNCVKRGYAPLCWRPPAGLTFHSDRGSQSTSHAGLALLREARVTESRSRTGNCYDNAVTESFFGTLGTECVEGLTFQSRSQARQTIFEYTECSYNRLRRHSTLGDIRPVNYEQLMC